MDTVTLKKLEDARSKLLEQREKLKAAIKDTRTALETVEAQIHDTINGLPLFEPVTGEIKE